MTHRRWGTALSLSGLTGELVAKRLLAQCGIDSVRVVQQGVKDAYDPWRNEIRLSPANFTGSTMSALATAAHEVGHAQQFAEQTRLARMHKIGLLICSIILGVAMTLPMASVLLDIPSLPLEKTGGIAFGLAVTMLLIQLPFILPLEHDASRRARQLVTQANLLSPSEQGGFDTLLRSAWMTYAVTEASRWIIVLVAGMVLCHWAPIWDRSNDRWEMAIAPDAVREPLEPAPPVEVNSPPVEVNAPPITSLSLLELLWPNFMLLLLALPMLLGVILLGRLFHPQTTEGDRAIMLNNSGLACYERGDHAAAIAAFDSALQLDPHMTATRYNRGQARLALNDLDGAEVDFRAALEVEPRLIVARVGLGDVALGRNDPAAAERAYDEAHRLAPQHASVLTSRGYVRWMRNDLDGAEGDFALALQYSPQDATALAGQGFVAMSRNHLERALAKFEGAAALGNRDAIAFAAQARDRLATEGADRPESVPAEMLS